MACLKKCSRQWSYWRETREARKFTPGGGFIYVRGLENADRLVEAWNGIRNKSNDEWAIAKVTDEMSGGWRGERFYCENFEPWCATTGYGNCCPADIAAKKTIIFKHLS